jgi:CheY-like chemotaxis protein
MQRLASAITILIVEDNPADIQLFKDIFSDYRIFNEFFWARDGDEAMRFVRDNRPHLVLLDTVLPMRDGFAILEEIKDDEGLKDTKVIMVYGAGDVDYVMKRAPRADGFLDKPITLEGLARTVSQIDGFSLGVVRS